MKGILFKPEMIQATVEGQKTNTRRAEAGLKEINREPDKWISVRRDQMIGIPANVFIFHNKVDREADGESIQKFIKPRYHIGEVVYIKEAWAEWINTSEHLASGVISIEEARADVIYKSATANWDEILKENGNPYLVKSTFFMPEWAARHFIKILDVRAERLQEITPEDAVMEGAIDSIFAIQQPKWMAIEMFRIVWNSINAKWKRVYNKDLKIYEFWQFPWCEADAKPVPKTEHPEQYHCIPNSWIFRYGFE